MRFNGLSPRLGGLLLALLCCLQTQAQVINEFVVSHTGSDDFEFFEFFGTANTDYSDLSILYIESDVADGPGTVDFIFNVGTTDANGIWWTGYLGGSQFANDDNYTLLLVRNFSGSQSDDLDTNDDGTFETMPWTEIVDEVAVADRFATASVFYSTIIVDRSQDGGSFEFGGASRSPNGVDTDMRTDWARNDFEGEGLGTLNGNVVFPEVANTPGLLNPTLDTPDFNVMISEFVIDHVGDDTAEYVEIFSLENTPLNSLTLISIDATGVIATITTPGSTNNGGFWVSDFQAGSFSDATTTFLLVSNFSGSLNQDLDTNNDGVFDVEPWDAIEDDVAISFDVADLVYSLSALNATEGSFGGASRYPYYNDTDTSVDWVLNDFDGEGLDGFNGNLAFGEAYNTPGRVSRVDAGSYYFGVDVTSQNALRMDLFELIQGHVRYPYTDEDTDTWDILEAADQDPGNASNIIDIYKNASYAKQGGGNDFYNREHVWAKTYGFGDDSPNNYPYTDAHHLRLSDSNYNSRRGSNPFQTCNANCTEDPTDLNNGVGGGSGQYPGNSNWRTSSGADGSYEVWGHRRGDIARSMFYMDVRYEGTDHPFTGFTDPQLILTDTQSLIAASGGQDFGTAYLGYLSVLLQWHEEDPVDEDERRRNEIVYGYQGNRNPFVDHPEWVDCVFNGNCAPTLTVCFFEAAEVWDEGGQSRCDGEPINILSLIDFINGTCECPE